MGRPETPPHKKHRQGKALRALATGMLSTPGPGRVCPSADVEWRPRTVLQIGEPEQEEELASPRINPQLLRTHEPQLVSLTESARCGAVVYPIQEWRLQQGKDIMHLRQLPNPFSG